MKKREPVSHIMTDHVLTLNLTHSLEDAEAMFKEHHIRHLPVVSGDKLIGMLSLTDLQRVSFVDSYSDGESSVDTAVYNLLSVQQVMNHNVESVDADTPIREVAEALSHKEFHALPVTQNGHLVGIVTTTDLVKYLLEQY